MAVMEELESFLFFLRLDEIYGHGHLDSFTPEKERAPKKWWKKRNAQEKNMRKDK